MPQVSVVIPAYNGASRYLGEAIESVLAQTVPGSELIVVDDASTDETARLVLRYSQVRYFKRSTNGGQAAARNDGARLAKGTYLAFLDQDDMWGPSFIEETLALLQDQPEVALVHCDGYQVNEDGAPLHYDAAMKQGRTITQLLRGGHDVATSGSLFRKTCFDAVGGYDDRLFVWEDIDLAIRLFQRFQLLHLAKPLYRHRLYSRNASRDIPSERSLAARRQFLEHYAQFCPSGTRAATALDQDWSRYYGDLGKYHLSSGNPSESRKAFWTALRHDPLNVKMALRLLRACLPHRRPALPA